MIRQSEAERIERLATKTQDQALLAALQSEFNYSPFESRAILTTVRETYLAQLRTPETLKPGQMVTLAIRADEPPGKPLKECQFVPIVITVHAAEDDVVRQKGGRQGVRQARRQQLERISWEAVAQDSLLTVEDLAYRILNCGVRTIEEDLAYFQAQERPLPLRGQQMDIGRTVSHKVIAVRLFLERQTYAQIERHIHHSVVAIQRYISDFVAVSRMTLAGQSLFEISFVRQLSPALVREYQALYAQYNTAEHRERLAEVLGQLGHAPDGDEKGGQKP